jgi:CheY-like chemotaxis protein
LAEIAAGAANGLFALKAAEPFEVLVSDFLMPGMDGPAEQGLHVASTSSAE